MNPAEDSEAIEKNMERCDKQQCCMIKKNQQIKIETNFIFFFIFQN